MIIHGRLGWIYGLKTTCKINFHSCPHRNSSCGPTKDGESEQRMNMAMFFNLAVIMVCIDWSQIKETCVRFCKCVHCEVHIVDYELALSCTVNEKAANKCKSSTCVPYYLCQESVRIICLKCINHICIQSIILIYYEKEVPGVQTLHVSKFDTQTFNFRNL